MDDSGKQENCEIVWTKKPRKFSEASEVTATFELLHAGAIFARAGVDFDLVARFHESRDLEHVACREASRLHHLAGGITLDGRFRVFDFANEDRGLFHADGAAFVEHHFGGHTVFEVLQGVFHHVGFDFVLVVFGVHPDIVRIGEVAVGHFLAIEDEVFELVVSAAPVSRFFNFIFITEALRPLLEYSAFNTTIGSLPIITTLPARSSCAIFIFYSSLSTLCVKPNARQLPVTVFAKGLLKIDRE